MWDFITISSSQRVCHYCTFFVGIIVGEVGFLLKCVTKTSGRNVIKKIWNILKSAHLIPLHPKTRKKLHNIRQVNHVECIDTGANVALNCINSWKIRAHPHTTISPNKKSYSWPVKSRRAAHAPANGSARFAFSLYRTQRNVFFFSQAPSIKPIFMQRSEGHPVIRYAY